MESHQHKGPEDRGGDAKAGESQGEKLAAVVFFLTVLSVVAYAGSVLVFVP